MKSTKLQIRLLFLFFFSFIFLFFSFPVFAQVDCTPGEIDPLYIFIPPSVQRSVPTDARVIGLPEKFRNQRLWLEYINIDTDDDRLFPEQYLIPIDVDADGNGVVSVSALDLNQSNNTGEVNFSVSLRGGPIVTQNDNQPVRTDYPLCYQPSYNVIVSGIGETCLNLGDECVPGEDHLACLSAEYGYCDDTQSPPRWRLPELPPVILNGANCDYLPTPGDATCEQANGNLLFACGGEVVTRPDSSDNSVDPIEQTRCCLNSDQCDLSMGIEIDGPADTSGPYAVCASNLNPSSTEFTSCVNCDGVWTAIGCIEKDPRSIAQKFIRVGTGIVGGVFLLRVLAAAFMLTTSQGDVKKTSEAKQMISEALVGVMVIIMSVSLIQFVGSDILQIPGFGG